MTAIDKSKLKRIITQCGSEDEIEMVRAVWNAAQAEEREECARICDELDNHQDHLHPCDCAEHIRQK